MSEQAAVAAPRGWQAGRIGSQLFIGTRPDPRAFVPAQSSFTRCWRNKPEGGLWTSSLQQGTSAWEQWCLHNQPEWLSGVTRWRLLPELTARLLVVDGYHDLEALMASYGRVMRSDLDLPVISFNALIGDGYDGLHLTEQGNAECHLSVPYDLNGWDCESTVWFRWCFVGDPVEVSR